MSDREWTTWILVCRRCGNGDLEMPFDSAEARGKWGAAHTKGTGHNSWWAPDPVSIPDYLRAHGVEIPDVAEEDARG